MGSYNLTCQISGTPITENDRIVGIPIVSTGQTCPEYGPAMTASRYVPYMFPVMGKYDTYGRIINIVDDSHTAIMPLVINTLVQTDECILDQDKQNLDTTIEVLSAIYDGKLKTRVLQELFDGRYQFVPTSIKMMYIHHEIYTIMCGINNSNNRHLPSMNDVDVVWKYHDDVMNKSGKSDDTPEDVWIHLRDTGNFLRLGKRHRTLDRLYTSDTEMDIPIRGEYPAYMMINHYLNGDRAAFDATFDMYCVMSRLYHNMSRIGRMYDVNCHADDYGTPYDLLINLSQVSSQIITKQLQRREE